ncbi:MAG: hypothetical protein KDM81_20140, partial [Verrucomicrobiae bacterium]|nr:hypothetical protein [Verrucomicrobiae bacterium]
MSAPRKQSRSFWSLFNEVGEPDAESEAPRFTDLLGEIGASAPGEDSPRNCALSPDRDYCFWAMRNLPVEEAAKHLLVCGCTGSGKTIAIQLFLQSIAHRFQPRSADPKAPEQLILFDAKTDLMPTLAGLGFLP